MTPDRIRRTLETILEDPEARGDPREAILAGLASRDPELCRLAGDAVGEHPSVDYLDPLWVVVLDGAAPVETREAALAGIAGVLVCSKEEPEAPDTADDLLDQAAIDAQVARLLDVYKDGAQPKDVRRRALEAAANGSNDPQLAEAARVALASGDPAWIMTGLLAIRLVDPEHAREPLVAALQHADEDVRHEALWGFGALGEEQDVAVLLAVARATGGADRSAAMRALAETPEPAAGMALSRLSNELSGSARREADEAYDLWFQQWGGFDEDELQDDDDDR